MPTIPIPARRAKKTQPPNGATNTSSLTAAPGPGQPVFAPPPKMRRRPFVWLTGAALVILSALTAAWAYRSIGQGHDIVALRSTVHRGEVITREDLMTVRIGTDPALHPLSAAQINDAVGKRAALDLAAGGVLSGEHGIGLVQRPYLDIVFSKTEMKLMRQIKKVFDPRGILNPGKIL